MVLLLSLAGMTLLALAMVLVPMLRPVRPPALRREADLRLYRDQLAEVADEQARGAIGAVEAEAARREIERRIVRAYAAPESDEAATATSAASARRRRIAVLAGIALLLPLGAGLLYARLGAAGAIGALPWRPSAEQRAAAEFGDLLGRLERKVAAEPDRPEGWALLGRMYETAGRFADAGRAFDRAAALTPDNADLRVAAAEALILGAGGQVTADAAQRVAQALALDPANPGARYYQGLGLWQGGERRAAYDLWRALLRDSPADAPWRGDLNARLAQAAATLGLPQPDAAAPSAEPGPAADDVARAARMTPDQRQAMIRGMVESLAARLRAAPDDLPGWLRLGRSYMVLGDPAKAAQAFGQARRLAPDDPDVLTGLAGAKAAEGDATGARALLERALGRLAAQDPRRAEAQRMLRGLPAAAPR